MHSSSSSTSAAELKSRSSAAGFSQMPAMGNPAMMFGVAILLAVAATAAATAGNATASPSAAAGNATASPTATKNTTAPLPPFGTNHAVGEGTGWFFDWKANASAANYSAWVANRTFYLGDYLSFKTDTGNTVVHTTNATVYRLCGAGDAAASSGGWKPEEAFLAVMLTTEGANYFLSDAWDGEHCRKGMRFEVTVAHGRGLPAVPQSYYEPLSGAPATRRLSGAAAMWVATAAAVALLFIL